MEYGLTITGEGSFCVGDIIKYNGKNHRVTKNTRTAVALERYYWWDAVYDWCVRKIKDRGVSS
jgi:hypothetical protein